MADVEGPSTQMAETFDPAPQKLGQNTAPRRQPQPPSSAACTKGKAVQVYSALS